MNGSNTMNIKQTLLDTEEFVDNKFLDEYVSLMQSNIDTKRVRCKTNNHHIVPRYVYKKKNLSIDNSSDNMVNLLYRDHILAHFYLSGCAIGQGKYWNLYAIYKNSGQKYFNKSDLDFVENLDSFQKIYEEAVHGVPNHRKGDKVSQATIEKMQFAQKLRCTERGPSNAGYVWINNGVKDTMIPKERLTVCLNNGYVKGRLYTHSEETKAKLVTYGKRSEEFCEKMRQIALKQPKKTAEAIEKNRKFLIEYYKTHENPFSGKKHSAETLAINRAKHLGKIAINKDSVVKMIVPEQYDMYALNGWNRGRK